MPKFSCIKELPYEAMDLFDLVLDINSYSEFVPFCKNSKIKYKSNNIIIAELSIQVKSFIIKYESNITFGSKNNEFFIEVKNISGPFKYLKNSWHFIELKESTEINFLIDFEMKVPILNNLIKLQIAKMTKIIISAFEMRANQLLVKKTYAK